MGACLDSRLFSPEFAYSVLDSRARMDTMLARRRDKSLSMLKGDSSYCISSLMTRTGALP